MLSSHCSTASQSVGRNAGHRSGVVDPEKDRAALGIRERHQLAGQVLGMGSGHPPSAQPQFLEFGAPVLPGANLFEHLRGAVEHDLLYRLASAASRLVARPVSPSARSWPGSSGRDAGWIPAAANRARAQWLR